MIEYNGKHRWSCCLNMSKSADSNKMELSIPTKIEEKDVLCGRGKIQCQHRKLKFQTKTTVKGTLKICIISIFTAGNKIFRELVNNSREKYNDGQTKSGRAAIVRSVIEYVHSLGGRFLQIDKVGQFVSTLILFRY